MRPDSRENIRAEVERIFKECSEPGWNGGKEDAISRSNADLAISTGENLPDGLPMPWICPAEDGTISFEWRQGKSEEETRDDLSVYFDKLGVTFAYLSARGEFCGEIDALPELLGRKIIPSLHAWRDNS